MDCRAVIGENVRGFTPNGARAGFRNAKSLCEGATGREFPALLFAPTGQDLYFLSEVSLRFTQGLPEDAPEVGAYQEASWFATLDSNVVGRWNVGMGNAVSPRGDMPKNRVLLLSYEGRSMSSSPTISSKQLARLVGTPNCPPIIDVQLDDDFAADPRLIPGAVRKPFDSVAEWASEFHGQSAVIVCQRGRKLSQGVAAWIRQEGGRADVLADGALGWAGADLPMIPAAEIPSRDAAHRTVWVTRARPKVDRVACPWLIRRFIDRNAVFLFVSPSEVLNVAERFGATAFDVDGASLSHQDGVCTFEMLLQKMALDTLSPLSHLGRIVRAADTGQLDAEPQAAGLLAASLGLSRMFADDLAQIDAGMMIYDAFFRWCRDATDETHDLASHRAPGARS